MVETLTTLPTQDPPTNPPTSPVPRRRGRPRHSERDPGASGHPIRNNRTSHIASPLAITRPVSPIASHSHTNSNTPPRPRQLFNSKSQARKVPNQNKRLLTLTSEYKSKTDAAMQEFMTKHGITLGAEESPFGILILTIGSQDSTAKQYDIYLRIMRYFC